MRDSNLFKTFHLDVRKEGLEREFIRQRENTELSEQELEQYYRQLEDIDAGNVTKAQRELVFESGAAGYFYIQYRHNSGDENSINIM